MFGMMPPEPMPDHKATPLFWSRMTQFMLFTAATTAIIIGVRHVEINAHKALVGE